MRSLAVTVLVVLVISIGARAEAAYAGQGDLPNAPSTYFWSAKFWTRSNATLIVLDAAAKGADFHYTMMGMDHRGLAIESDPIARPFVSHGNAAGVAYFGGLFALDVFTSYEFHKHHHDKLSKAVLVIGIANNGYGAQYSGRQY